MKKQLITGYAEFGPSLTEDDLYGRSSTAIGIPRNIDVRPIKIYPDKESALAAKRQVVTVDVSKPKPQPTSCPSVLPRDKWPTIRLDAASLFEDEKTDWISPLFLHYSPRQILDELFAPDDLLQFILPSYGPTTKRYSILRANTDSYSKLAPNALLVDDQPARRFLVTRFADIPFTGCLKRVSHLRHHGELALAVYDAMTGGVEAWWSVAGLSQAKLASLYTKAVNVHADPRCGLGSFLALMPNAKVETGRSMLQELKSVGIIKNEDHLNRLSKRNFVLHFDPPTKAKSK